MRAPLLASALPKSLVEELTLPETERQRRIADARRGVLQQIEHTMATTGCSARHACRTMLTNAGSGRLDAVTLAALRLARDSRGRCSLDGLPSVRSLQRFIGMEAHGASLTPRIPQKNLTIPPWGADFLRHYARPEKPSLSQSYRAFAECANAEGVSYPIPSEWAVRRFVHKAGAVAVHAGRMGARELKSLQAFVRRDTGDLLPGDIYSADGHTFDAEIRHPAHGRPFRPEITTVIDVATRRLVGWSVDLAESALAVLDALRTACVKHCICALFYVDRGSGYDNDLMKDEAVGLLSRLGAQVTHSLPYNSQARGVIERSHRTVLVAAAKDMPGFVGADMDPEARQAMFKITRKALKQAGNVASLPLMTFDAFVKFLAGKVAEYNARPHRFLPKIADPATGKYRHESPDEAWARHVAEGWQAEAVEDDHIVPLFRPQELRAIRRCEIQLHGKRYFSEVLEEFHGETLPVGYDINDPGRIWVYDADGRYITTAELNANLVPYMPLSYVEQAREKRAAARERRLVAHLDEVHAERNAGLIVQQPENIVLPGLTIPRENLQAEVARIAAEPAALAPIAAAAPASEIAVPEWTPPAGETFEAAQTRYAEWQRIAALPEAALPNERARVWRASYPRSAEYRLLAAERQRAAQTA